MSDLYTSSPDRGPPATLRGPIHGARPLPPTALRRARGRSFRACSLTAGHDPQHPGPGTAPEPVRRARSPLEGPETKPTTRTARLGQDPAIGRHLAAADSGRAALRISRAVTDGVGASRVSRLEEGADPVVREVVLTIVGFTHRGGRPAWWGVVTMIGVAPLGPGDRPTDPQFHTPDFNRVRPSPRPNEPPPSSHWPPTRRVPSHYE